MLRLITILILSVCLGQNTFAQSSNLTLQIEDIKPFSGNLMIAVFNNEMDFKAKENPVSADTITIKNSSIEITFKAIPAGIYAVAIYHDENSDGAMNTVKLGIPSEGVGFSGILKTALKKPKFEDCRFELNNDTTIIVNMYYRGKNAKAANAN